MAVIQRADGTQFVIRCYRETLSLSNSTLFKQHAFLISEMHGYFSKFLPAKSSKNTESVFSTDAGFLLAEMIWYHFGKPANMIFCEKLDAEHYITIIVRDELVYTDGNLEQTELLEELAAASINMQSATIYLHGEIPGFARPMAVEDDVPLLNFNPKNIVSLPNSLFNELKTGEFFELVPIQQAISDLQLSKASKRNIISLGVFGAVIVAAIVAYFILAKPEPQPEQVDPLLGFTRGLKSPAPKPALTQATQEILAASNIPGWQVEKARIKNGTLTGTVRSYGGTASMLLDWAKINKANVKFINAGAEISFSQSALSNRASLETPVPLQQTLARLLDVASQLLSTKSVTLGAVALKGAYSTQGVVVNLLNVSPQTILLFATFLNTLPITVDDVIVSDTKNLISANVSLTLYGT